MRKLVPSKIRLQMKNQTDLKVCCSNGTAHPGDQLPPFQRGAGALASGFCEGLVRTSPSLNWKLADFRPTQRLPADFGEAGSGSRWRKLLRS